MLNNMPGPEMRALHNVSHLILTLWGGKWRLGRLAVQVTQAVYGGPPPTFPLDFNKQEHKRLLLPTMLCYKAKLPIRREKPALLCLLPIQARPGLRRGLRPALVRALIKLSSCRGTTGIFRKPLYIQSCVTCQMDHFPLPNLESDPSEIPQCGRKGPEDVCPRASWAEDAFASCFLAQI